MSWFSFLICIIFLLKSSLSSLKYKQEQQQKTSLKKNLNVRYPFLTSSK